MQQHYSCKGGDSLCGLSFKIADLQNSDCRKYWMDQEEIS